MRKIASLTNLKTRTVAIWCVIGLIVMVASGTITESAFAKVKYPDSGFGGVPLTFDFQLKQDNLDILEYQRTLDLFVTVQYLDFGLVIGTLLFFVFLAVLTTQAFPATSAFHKLGRLAAASFFIAPSMDALENVSILILIALRQEHNLLWLNLLNSCFTLGKIAFFTIGWLLIGIVFVALIVVLVRRMVFHKIK